MSDLIRALQSNMLTKADELVGMTVESAHMGYNSFYMRVRDISGAPKFMIVRAEPSYDNSVDHDIADEVDPYEDFDYLVKIGSMTQLSVDHYEKERKDARNANQVAQEKAEYERLKKKFG